MAETTQTSSKANTATASTPASAKTAPASGLRFARKFSRAGVSPYDEVQWERRTAAINDMSGKIIFEQKDVEVPVDWSMTATNIVASKYLHGQTGTPERESGVRALVGRVADTIAAWGKKGGYFASDEDAAKLPRRPHPPPRPAEGRLQLARLVQRRLRSTRAELRRAELALGSQDARGRLLHHRLSQSAVLRLLHQLRR